MPIHFIIEGHYFI